MAKATPPLGKHSGFVWQKLHLSEDNKTVLFGKSYTSLRKTQRFCMAKATPPLGKHKVFCMAKATPPLGKHKGFVWQKLDLPQENTNIFAAKKITPP